MKQNSKLKTFILDDDTLILKIIASFLTDYASEKGCGIAIRSITDPIEALAELESQGDRYDLIILDVRISAISGSDIYATMLSTYPRLSQKTLFSTGYSHELSARFPDQQLRIIEKPFRYEQFVRSIHPIIG